MKRLLLLFLCFFVTLQSMAALKVFVPKGKGFVLRESTEGSLNDIGKSLGYNLEQYYNYTKYEGSDIFSIFFKIFTQEIIAVVCEEQVTGLTIQDVNSFLDDFNYLKEFSPYERESILNTAIKNKTLSFNYMLEVLKVPKQDDNTIISKEYGLKFDFKDGVLVSFSVVDGLNRWSREMKEQNRDFFNLYYQKAEEYWGEDQEKIAISINTQTTAFSEKIPNGFSNEHISEFKDGNGFINFKMLAVTYYNDDITLREFKDINYGKYRFVKKMTKDGKDYFIYLADTSYCLFDKNGILVLSDSIKQK